VHHSMAWSKGDIFTRGVILLLCRDIEWMYRCGAFSLVQVRWKRVLWKREVNRERNKNEGGNSWLASYYHHLVLDRVIPTLKIRNVGTVIIFRVNVMRCLVQRKRERESSFSLYS